MSSSPPLSPAAADFGCCFVAEVQFDSGLVVLQYLAWRVPAAAGSVPQSNLCWCRLIQRWPQQTWRWRGRMPGPAALMASTGRPVAAVFAGLASAPASVAEAAPAGLG